MGQADRAAWEGEMFRLLAENVLDYAVFIVNPGRHVLSWSKGAERLLGFTEPEIVGRKCDLFFTPEDAAAGVPQKELDDALATGRGDDDRWHVRKDGTRFWSSGMVTPLRDDGGTLRGFAKIMRDRTDLKRTQDAHDDALAYAEAIVATVREPLVVLDGDLQVRTANRSFYRTFRVRPGDTEGRRLYDLGNGQWDIPALRRLMGEVLPRDAAFDDFEVEHDFPGVGRKTMLLNARKLWREGNHTELILLAIEDVTALRAAERGRRDAESRFTEMVRNVRDHSIFLTDPDGVITSWNVAAERIIGYAEAEAVGRHFSLIFTPEDVAAGVPGEELRQAREDGRAEDERWHRRKDGSVFWALGIVTPLHDPDGRLSGYSKILRDMTAWKRAEEELAASQRRLQAVFDALPVGVGVADAAGKLVLANRAMGRYLPTGVLPSRDDDRHRRWAARWPDGRPVERADFPAARALRGDRVVPGVEVLYTPDDGAEVWTQVAAVPTRDADGHVAGLVTVVTDIDTPKRVEAALRASEARLANAQRIAGVGSWEVDWPTRRVWWSAETYRLLGVDPAAFEPTVEGFLAFVPDEDRPAVLRAVDAALAGAADYRVDHRVVRADGAVRWVSEQAEVAFGPGGEPVRVTGTVLDITDRRAATEALRESERQFRLMADAIPQIVWITDAAGRAEFFNRQWEAYTGVPFEPATAAEVAAGFVHPDDGPPTLAAFEQARRTGGTFRVEHRIRSAAGEYRWFLVRAEPYRDPATGRVVRWYGTSTDVHDAKAAGQALKESEGRFRGLMEQAPFSVQVLAPDGRTVRVNRAWEELWGLTLDQLGDYNLLADPQLEAKGLLPFIRRAFAGEAARVPAARYDPDETLPGRTRHRDAGRWVAAVAYPLKDDAGRVREVVLVHDDRTAAVRAEQAVRASEERLRAALAAARMVAWEWTPADGRLRVSENAADVFGLPAGVGLTGIDQGIALLHPDDAAAYRATFRRALADRAGYFTRYRLIRPVDGRVVWVEERGQAVFDQPGGAARLFGVAADVTAREEAEERFRTLFEAMDEGYCVIEVIFDPPGGDRAVDYRFLEVNPAFEAQSGMRDVVGRRMREFVADIEDHWLANYGRVALTGEPVRFANEYTGLNRWFEVYAFRVGGEGSRRVGVLFTDITRRKQAEADREGLVGQLRDADRRKDEFLATLAHELRNPLAPLRNGLQVMKLAAGNPGAVEQARAMMERQLGQMVHLIDDLLDVSRITRGKLHLRRERVELTAVVRNAVEVSRPVVEASAHRLDVTLPAEPVWLDADPTRLAQVFSNLLTNAAKYTERGGDIRVAAGRDGDEVVVSVRDTGIGIAPEHLPRLFEMFSQVDSALERSQGGLGIGLALVRGLVEMHGGTVEARSEGRGRGSEFVVRLPGADGPAVRPNPSGGGEPASARPGRRILVADDNRDAADSLAVVLRLGGHEVHTAHDGLAAVDAAGRVRPDVAILDIGMPGLTGYDAARRIRAEAWGRGVVLVALTGWGQDEDRRRAAAAGFDHHLTKPVDPTDLDELLARGR